MMMSEFVERTGFQPTADEYDQIEAPIMPLTATRMPFARRLSSRAAK